MSENHPQLEDRPENPQPPHANVSFFVDSSTTLRMSTLPHHKTPLLWLGWDAATYAVIHLEDVAQAQRLHDLLDGYLALVPPPPVESDPRLAATGEMDLPDEEERYEHPHGGESR